LGTTLRNKNIIFEEECKIFEVCNPTQAAQNLAIDMQLNMVLLCRISVFTERGKTKIGLIKARQMLSALSDDSTLAVITDDIEKRTIQIVDAAK
jgi:uncharacterized protein (DUF302 family)